MALGRQDGKIGSDKRLLQDKAWGEGDVQRPAVLMASCSQVGLYLEARAEIACIWVLWVEKIIDWILWISSFLMFSMRKQ